MEVAEKGCLKRRILQSTAIEPDLVSYQAGWDNAYRFTETDTGTSAAEEGSNILK